MPFNSGGRWYNDPQEAYAIEAAPAIYTASTTLGPFSAQDYDGIMATLGTHNFLQTGAANSGIDWVAQQGGTATTAITITLVAAGLNTALSVGVVTNAITVNLSTDGAGASTATANQVIAAIKAPNSTAQTLVNASLSAGSNGTGVVAAAGSAPLAGWTGTTPSLTVGLQTALTTGGAPGTFYTIASWPAKTAVGPNDGLAFSGLGDQMRWNVTISGTTPRVAFSIRAFDHTLGQG